MSGDLDRRLAALGRAAELAEGRLEDGDAARARAVVDRAGRRLGLGLEATVVALAGPTGAGKSSLFNALAGAELATASPRRPTTSAAAAAVWGEAGDELLDWLEVPRRHRMEGGDGRSDGLVLLDLPDFDSIQAAHREEFERLLGLVDLAVWVVDPQKYADATLHDRYLRPLAGHGATTVLVLNQADRLSEAGLAACRADLGRLLQADGLDGVPVLPVSATGGAGIGALREVVQERVAARTAALERLAADVESAARPLAAGCEGPKGAKVPRAAREALSAALAEAAGVPGVAEAVARAHRRRGVLATGWPFARWVRRLRPDPLKRLRVGEGRGEEHTGLPAATPVQHARVDAASRALAAQAAEPLPAPWPGLVRGAATAREGDVAERLDRAVAGADLRLRPPRWWRLAGLLQLVLAAAVAAGVLWLVVLAALSWLRLDDALPVPDALGLPVPTLLLAGGALAGLLLAALTRVLNGLGARRRARRAERALRRPVEDVAQELVVAPVEAELAAREDLCAAVAEVLRASGPWPRRSRS